MEYQAITRTFLDVQGKVQDLLGEHMSLVRDAETDDDRDQAIILLRAAQKAAEALTKGLADVDPIRPWQNLIDRNTKTVNAFLEDIGNGTV